MLVLFILFPAELQALCPSIIFFFSFSDGKTALKSSVCIGLLAFFLFVFFLIILDSLLHFHSFPGLIWAFLGC